MPGIDLISGSVESAGAVKEVVDMEFYGVNMVQDIKVNEFFLTASSISNNYLSKDRRYYVGAHRENFNGDLKSQSFSKISSLPSG